MSVEEWNYLYGFVFNCKDVDGLKTAMHQNGCLLSMDIVHEFLVTCGYSLLAIKVAETYGIKLKKEKVKELMKLKETMANSNIREDKWDAPELINYLLHFGYIKEKNLTERDKKDLKEHLKQNPRIS